MKETVSNELALAWLADVSSTRGFIGTLVFRQGAWEASLWHPKDFESDPKWWAIVNGHGSTPTDAVSELRSHFENTDTYKTGVHGQT